MGITLTRPTITKKLSINSLTEKNKNPTSDFDMFNLLSFNMRPQPSTDIQMDEIDTVRIYHLYRFVELTNLQCRPGVVQSSKHIPSSQLIPTTTHPLERPQGAIPIITDPRPSGPSSSGMSRAVPGAFPPMQTAMAVDPNQSMTDQEAFVSSQSDQSQHVMDLDATPSQRGPLLGIEAVSQHSTVYPPLPQQRQAGNSHGNTEPQQLPDHEPQPSTDLLVPKPFTFTSRPKLKKHTISIRRRLGPEKEVPGDMPNKRYNESTIDAEHVSRHSCSINKAHLWDRPKHESSSKVILPPDRRWTRRTNK